MQCQGFYTHHQKRSLQTKARLPATRKAQILVHGYVYSPSLSQLRTGHGFWALIDQLVTYLTALKTPALKSHFTKARFGSIALSGQLLHYKGQV